MLWKDLLSHPGDANFANTPAPAGGQPARPQNGQPRPGAHPTGAVFSCPNDPGSTSHPWSPLQEARTLLGDPGRRDPGFGKRTCKPNSVVCGHSSRRRVAADAHQRPTRRFRQWREHPSGENLPPEATLRAALPHRADAERRPALGLYPFPGRFPPYLVLLRVGFTLPLALLPARCALTAPFHPYRTGRPGERRSGQLPVPKHEHPAVCFLWHWPSTGLEARVPDVIRHTALRSSDFPLPGAPRFRVESPAATARSSCQCLVYRENGFTSCGKGFWRGQPQRLGPAFAEEGCRGAKGPVLG